LAASFFLVNAQLKYISGFVFGCQEWLRLWLSSSGVRTVQTKSGKKLVQAVRVGEDRDTVRAQRAVYVRDFDNLERRHDRYVSVKYGSSSNEETEGEKQWIQVVIYEHQGTLSMCDTYLSQMKPAVHFIENIIET
jgi:hypothetical protein